MSMEVKVRSRVRHGGRPSEGLEYAWTEFQVVNGRYIISRHDTAELAEKAASKLRTGLIEIRNRLVIKEIEKRDRDRAAAKRQPS